MNKHRHAVASLALKIRSPRTYHKHRTCNLLYKWLGLVQHADKVSAARHLSLFVIFMLTKPSYAACTLEVEE